MPVPRFFHPEPLHSGGALALGANAARHVQVLRLQPGAAITLFDGRGGEYAATVERIGRSDVRVRVGAHSAVEREAARAIHLAVGIPANDRMDWLVEKATELGAASIQPLVTERSVLRLSGERAEKKRAHWQAIAASACEQCGRNRVPALHAAAALPAWLATRTRGESPMQGMLLSTTVDAVASPAAAGSLKHLRQTWLSDSGPLCILSGPEGGFADAEQEAALSAGFVPASLGVRVLRAETAALAALAYLSIP